MSSHPFEAGDSESIEDYCRKMRRLQAASWGKPLAAGVSFTFILASPFQQCSESMHPEMRSEVMHEVRPMPHLPYGEARAFILSRPLQVGHNYESQVWVATDPGQVYADVLLKFIAPSFLRLPYESLRVIDVEAGDYWYPADVVHRQVAAYLALDDFQGSTLPYFCGMHEAVMPWGEQASVLALEYLPGPNLRVAKDTVDSYSSSSKYQDFEAYLALVNSAISTVRAAHSRDVRHRDLREENMLVDESNDLAVIIDWHNNPRTIDDPGFIAGMDLFKLASTFLRCDRHRKQLREHYRTAHPDIHMSTRFGRF